jgi:hypothetical protein
MRTIECKPATAGAPRFLAEARQKSAPPWCPSFGWRRQVLLLASHSWYQGQDRLFSNDQSMAHSNDP